MPITQKFYPSFFEKMLIEQIGFDFHATAPTMQCKIALYDEDSTGYDVGKTLLSDYTKTTYPPPNFLPLELQLSSLTNSTKDVTLTMTVDGDSLKFALSDVLWTAGDTGEVSNGQTFRRMIVYEPYTVSSVTYNALVMWIDMGETITIDGPFRLRMNANGQADIDFDSSTTA